MIKEKLPTSRHSVYQIAIENSLVPTKKAPRG